MGQLFKCSPYVLITRWVRIRCHSSAPSESERVRETSVDLDDIGGTHAGLEEVSGSSADHPGGYQSFISDRLRMGVGSNRQVP